MKHAAGGIGLIHDHQSGDFPVFHDSERFSSQKVCSDGRASAGHAVFDRALLQVDFMIERPTQIAIREYAD